MTRERDADVVVLTECDHPDPVLQKLNSGASRFFHFRKSLDERFVVFSRLPRRNLEEERAYGGLSFFRLDPVIGNEILLVAAHLPSKLWANADDQAFYSGRCARELVDLEKRLGHQRTILVGDVNMNPFEVGMVGAGGFHATPARTVAQKGTRTIHGEQYGYFYNPMWNYLGDDWGPPGTYYHDSPSPTEGHWHLLDQVLVRPVLLSALPRKGAGIITTIAGRDLVLEDGRIDQRNASDHLPIYCTLDFTEEWA